MIGNLIYEILTSTIAAALLSGVSVAGIAGTALGIIPAGWAILAKWAGRIALLLVVFIAGCRFADERHDMQSLKNTLEVRTTDLKNEQEARASDLKTIKELSDQKEKAERDRDELSTHISTLPLSDQCIATPDMLKRLHKPR